MRVRMLMDYAVVTMLGYIVPEDLEEAPDQLSSPSNESYGVHG